MLHIKGFFKKQVEKMHGETSDDYYDPLSDLLTNNGNDQEEIEYVLCYV